MKQLAKREAIEFLLEHWTEIHDPSGSTAAPMGAPDDGSGVALMPLMARHPSVKELETCIAALGRYAPGHCSHLMTHYQSETRLAYERQPVRNHQGQVARDKAGQTVFEMVAVRERVLPFRTEDQLVVHNRMVERSVDFLCATFRGVIFIPEALMEAAA